MLTESDITVINRVYDKTTRLDGLVCTHIYGAHWEDTKAANVIKSGMKDADKTTVYIPFKARVGGGKSYRPPLEFKKAPKGCFTLREGDFIVKGIAEYSGSAAKLEEAFDSVITINSVDTYDYGSPYLRHWEVSGG